MSQDYLAIAAFFVGYILSAIMEAFRPSRSGRTIIKSGDVEIEAPSKYDAERLFLLAFRCVRARP